MQRLRWHGIGLFTFIPLVLYLYLALPLGPMVSLLLGVALMLGHRWVAGPWMARHALARCLWCGAAGQPTERLEVSAGGRTHTLAACSSRHRERCARFLTFIARRRRWIGLGIFLPLLLLLVGTLLAGLGLPSIPQELNGLQFRLLVALTVVSASIGYRGVAQSDPRLQSPFPLHNLFLLGIHWTLWVFRLVGAWWLIAGGWQLLRVVLAAPGER